MPYVEEMISLLASDAQWQIASFPDFVCVPDEIALANENLVDWLQWNTYEGSAEVVDCLAKINERFDDMSDKPNNGTWTLEGLETEPDWQEIRQMARAVAEKVGLPFNVVVTFEGVTYVPSEPRQGCLLGLFGRKQG